MELASTAIMSTPMLASVVRKRIALRLRSMFSLAVVVLAVGAAPASARLYVATWTGHVGSCGGRDRRLRLW